MTLQTCTGIQNFVLLGLSNILLQIHLYATKRCIF